jgi:hypothetical protein
MNITERAGDLLYQILQQTQVPENRCLRLNLTVPGAELVLGREEPGDEIVSYRGRRVLALDAYTAEACVNRLLDFNGRELLIMDWR